MPFPDEDLRGRPHRGSAEPPRNTKRSSAPDASGVVDAERGSDPVADSGFPPAEPPADPGPLHGDDPRVRVGAYLRREREARQLSLEELAQTTRIPLRTLALMEAGRFDELPGDVFARGFLKSYARTLGLPEDEVLGRYDGLRGTLPPDPTPRSSVLGPPERESGFGIAIALVILLVLFTLALSIVLRPRRRDAPVELSGVPARFLDGHASAVLAGPGPSPRLG